MCAAEECTSQEVPCVLGGGWLSICKAQGEELKEPAVPGRGCVAVAFRPSWHTGEIVEGGFESEL